MILDADNEFHAYHLDMLIVESLLGVLSIVEGESFYYHKEILIDVYLDSYIGHHKE